MRFADALWIPGEVMSGLVSRFAVVAGVAFLVVGNLSAQDHPNIARGFWADHAYELGGIDHVNEFSGNLILSIPLGQTYRSDGSLGYQLSLVYQRVDESALFPGSDFRLPREHGDLVGNDVRLRLAQPDGTAPSAG